MTVVFFCRAPAVAAGGPGGGGASFHAAGAVTEVIMSSHSFIRAATDLGFHSGAVPGSSLGVMRDGRLIGTVLVDESGPGSSAGVFRATCEGCRPEPGDRVVPPGSAPLPGPPRIAAPPRHDAAEKEELDDDEHRALRRVFQAFLDGAPLDAPADYAPAAGPETECPGGAAPPPDSDADIEPDIFLKAGDFIAVTGLKNGETECLHLGAGGYVQSGASGRWKFSGRTIAQLEREIRLDHRGLPDDFDITLLPAGAGGAVEPAGMISIYIMGGFEPTGFCRSAKIKTVRDVPVECGAPDEEFTGSALLVRFGKGGAGVLRSISLFNRDARAAAAPDGAENPPAPAGVPMVGPAVTTAAAGAESAGAPGAYHPAQLLRDGDILFFPVSEAHRSAFIGEVLPWLSPPDNIH